jgi:hypothetical protein
MNESHQSRPGTTGAINPKVLAELKLGRTLDPKSPDFKKIVSEALGLPYEQLFDPKYKSPVFSEIPIKKRDLSKRRDDHDEDDEHREKFGADKVGGGNGSLKDSRYLNELVYRIPYPIWWSLIISDLNFGVPGDFITDVPTATSPIQGGLADCWLISAMASVAWTDSRSIAEKTTRRNGTGDIEGDNANYVFDFYSSSSWATPVEKTVRVDVPQTSGMYIYARSSVADETWPANLEKAFIAMRGGSISPEPFSTDYNKLNYGDAAWGVASLVGRAPWYHSANASDAWSVITSHCASGRTTTPLVAWTYGSSTDAPTSIDYSSANIVANHAYSILGTWSDGGSNYVVLRNPWGYLEATIGVDGGSWPEHESWGWDNITVPDDGVFALRIDVFSAYYAGFGGA